jgi:hypothetical protein
MCALLPTRSDASATPFFFLFDTHKFIDRSIVRDKRRRHLLSYEYEDDDLFLVQRSISQVAARAPAVKKKKEKNYERLRKKREEFEGGAKVKSTYAHRSRNKSSACSSFHLLSFLFLRERE